MKKIRKAVIPIAGMGTRFLPITKAVAKEMLPIIDKPIIHYVVEEAINSGIEEILFITSPYKKVVEDYFDVFYELEARLQKDGKLNQIELINQIPSNVKFYYIRQGEPLGTGHAISKAQNFIGNEPFAILFGDDIGKCDVPLLKQLIATYEKYDCNVLAVHEVPHDKVDQYGIIEFENEEYKVKKIVEKPAIGSVTSSVASIGRYILKPEIFDELQKISLNNGEYYLTDAFELLMEYQDFYACQFVGECYDAGNQEGYLKANLAYASEDKKLFENLLKFIKTL